MDLLTLQVATMEESGAKPPYGIPSLINKYSLSVQVFGLLNMQPVAKTHLKSK